MFKIIASLDIETYGSLEDTRIKVACLWLERRKNPLFFYNKEDLWNKILKIGKAEAKNGKVFSLYAHNHAFDYYRYADFKSKNIKNFCHRPFIVAYCENGREIIKFLDSYSLFKMKLSKLGEMVGYKKQETPLEILKKEENTKEEMDLIKEYCARDTEIVLKSIKFLQNKIKDEGIGVKRLITAQQIGINYIINELRKNNETDILKNVIGGETWRTRFKNEIAEAYRGGRVEPFKLGKFKNMTCKDINSLYPKALMEIEIPKLKTERKLFNPLNFLTKEELFNKIGISKCLIYNKNCERGLLQIRSIEGNSTPKRNKWLYGTWTHLELREAIKEGYEIKAIEWSVIWEKMNHNPFRAIMESLYKKRKNKDNEFNNYFYKMMMNAGIGKMAQSRIEKETITVNIEDIDEYIKKGYNILNGMGYDMLIQKKNIIYETKKYYMPIIPTLVNAWSRVYLYKNAIKIVKEPLYCDTDSIIYIDNGEKLIEGTDIGLFKTEEEKESGEIWGKKGYKIGNKIVAGGGNLTYDNYKKGIILSQSMNTINNCFEENQYGKVIIKEESLEERKDKSKTTFEKMKEVQVFIDGTTKIEPKTIDLIGSTK